MKPVDIFCGAGGLTRGLANVGLYVAAGFDAGGALGDSYERNNPRPTFIHKDVRKAMADDILVGRCVGPSAHIHTTGAGVLVPSCSNPDTGGAKYVQLDHVTPISGGGSHDLSNRALLCRPCNGDKSDTRTIVWLRQQAGYATGRKQGTRHEIDLEIARLRTEEHVRGLRE